jgi:hypothetical protein
MLDLTEPHVCRPGCPDWPGEAVPAETEREQLFHWSPSRGLILKALASAGAGVAILGLMGFALSFQAVSSFARPLMGQSAAMLPLIIDLGILVLTAFSLVLAMAGMPSRVIAAVPTGLSVFTLYLNVAEQHTAYGVVVHGAGPLMWITTVEAGGLVVRKLVGLHGKPVAIERVRFSLWLLRPLPTLRLWRQMRVHQITTYAGALDRDAARAVVKGRMRLHHGRFWRWTAPLAERIALRLQGREVTGVAEELSAHQTRAALLVDATPDATPEPVPAAPAATAPVPAQPATAPAPVAAPVAAAKRVRQTPGAGRVRTVTALTDAELADAAEAIERAALAASNGTSGASYRAVQAQLHVSYPKAKAALDTARERIAAKPLTLVNGSVA